MVEWSAQDFCRAVLLNGDLSSKLRPPRDGSGKLLPFASGPAVAPLRIETPAREPELRFGRGAERLPGLGALTDPAARAACLRRFAHHELLAIELFAWAILRFPSLPPPLLRGFLLVLEEEQEHLRLYLARLAHHGARLGDGPLSDYLWQHRARIEAHEDPPLAFLCALGLTFEQANLDFALLYRDAFLAAGDAETAAVLQRVHDDEIRHVRLAVRWLRRLKRQGESDVAAYQRAVPFPLSAARAKGRRFDVAARRQAGLDDAFIAHVAQAEPYASGTHGQTLAEAARAGSPGQLFLLPNLGAEESQAVPAGARGFLRGLYGAWAALFSGRPAPPWLLPPGDNDSQAAWRQALALGADGPALACLDELGDTGLVAWLNTPSAAATGQAHRLPLLGPSPAVVLAVHDKAYAQLESATLGLVPSCLAGLSEIFSAEECRDAGRATARLLGQVAGWPAWTGRRFVLKPRLGTSGRGRFFGSLSEPPLSASAWLALAHRGGCIAEPWLERLADLSVQLVVRPSGVEILGTTEQLVTRSGQIRGNRGIVDAAGRLQAGTEPALEAALVDAARRLGQAVGERGFRGVAGIDAFVFRGPDGQAVLRPVVELNARFTTGTVALGLVRRLEAAGRMPRPGAWALLLKAPPGDVLAAAAEFSWVCPLLRGPALVFAASPDALAALC